MMDQGSSLFLPRQSCRRDMSATIHMVNQIRYGASYLNDLARIGVAGLVGTVAGSYHGRETGDDELDDYVREHLG
jgi:hypothetical protein